MAVLAMAGKYSFGVGLNSLGVQAQLRRNIKHRILEGYAIRLLGPGT
jgi:hypothetical protein